ncbi:hypothetical protein JQC92_04290 [Shewanella sp. 202IG2-18]|uniref:hypothetical protein n=1 Tax=Parashewanella hymeniacidonis TaxID=2807618 RepID=UPI0019608736|nr:hypothetical protein [Parashewanella hymeniacidonis]MBM7071260.1 hypothetical protein [Parashewanella hymeniacidonis]
MRLTSLIVLVCVSLNVEASISPIVLDNYPLCSDERAETITVKKAVKATENSDENREIASKLQSELIKSIKEKAANLGSNAIVLTDKNSLLSSVPVNALKSTKYDSILKLSYKAMLYKDCDLSLGFKNQPTPIASNGNRHIAALSNSKKQIFSYEFILDQDKQTRPKIKSNSVSIAEGVYGVKLNDSIETLINTLGLPSIQLQNQNYSILGFGRAHWFYFFDNKLVRFSTKTSELSYELLNQLEFLPFFDDKQWKVNSIIPYKGGYQDFKKHLKSAKRIKDTFEFSQSERKLTAEFFESTNFHENKKNKSLDAISLSNGHHDFTISSLEVGSGLHKINALVKSNTHSVSNVLKAMSEPIAKAYTDDQSVAYLFDQHTLLSFKHGNLAKITFLDNALPDTSISKLYKPTWSFGEINVLKSYNELKHLFDETAIEMDNQVEYETQLYNVTLMFDEDNRELYSASFEIL